MRARSVPSALLLPALLAILLTTLLALLVAPAPPAAAGAGAPRTEQLRVPVGAEPGGGPVDLDATLWLPAGAGPAHRVPAVLLAHGFGGSKASSAPQARSLAQAGYAVLAWTARGFGASGGSVHLDSPDYEVADARALVDLLARRPEVAGDAPGDPRVGVVGASYGGALGLLLAGTDRRVDAVAAAITWSDLATALVPQAAAGGGEGVFKAGWAAQLTSSLTAPALSAPGARAGGAPPASAGAAACGRLAADLCAAYLATASTGRAGPALRALLARSSPAAVLGATRAAVLLVQGEQDSLFGLGDSLANAAAARSAGVPVRLDWVPGGHDGGFGEADWESRARTWLDAHLRGAGAPGAAGPAGARAGFEVSVQATSAVAGAAGAASVRRLPALPGGGAPGTSTRLALHPAPRAAPVQPVLSPAGGRPASLTSIPGLGGLSALAGLSGVAGGSGDAGGRGAGGGAGGGGGAGASLGTGALPGQSAVFETAPLTAPLTLMGASRVRLRVTSSAADAVLFASLDDVADDGSADLPSGLVAPLRVPVPSAGRPVDVDVALPAVVRDLPAGHRLRLVVSTTDSAYAVPTDPRVATVAVAPGGDLVAATAPPGARSGGGGLLHVPWPQVALVAGAVLVAAASWLLTALRRRRAALAPPPPAARGGGPSGVGGAREDEPVLVVRDLEKVYGDGFRAVDGVSFTVGRGQVVGLLGPNGAGKTTTLRMLMGLLRPTAGSIAVLGHPVRPGAPVLARVGALVEGPGFLPHLSGLENLRLYWRSTGRPEEEAHLQEALAVADLGEGVNRRVRGYSQGMRQRLGIAQAMLGMPDLLVLDEPTNGLDPPQITAMREVLRRYAATGRTVLVSSHLLSEVEQTCSHAVVMARGRVLASGTVADLTAGSGEVVVAVGPGGRERAAAVLDGTVRGERDGGLLVSPGPGGAAPLVAALVAAGVGVERVVPQRHLEEVFLELVAGAADGDG